MKLGKPKFDVYTTLFIHGLNDTIVRRYVADEPSTYRAISVRRADTAMVKKNIDRPVEEAIDKVRNAVKSELLK